MEASCQESVRNVLDHLEWLDLSDFTFIMLGATSEMGPLQFLLDCGASVVSLLISSIFSSLIYLIMIKILSTLFQLGGRGSTCCNDSSW